MQRVSQPEITQLLGKIIIDSRGTDKLVRIPQLITAILEDAIREKCVRYSP